MVPSAWAVLRLMTNQQFPLLTLSLLSPLE
jgi:hypothetical protein